MASKYDPFLPELLATNFYLWFQSKGLALDAKSPPCHLQNEASMTSNMYKYPSSIHPVPFAEQNI